MTTRIAKTTRSRTTRRPEVILMCPACRVPRRARAIGTATVDHKRREVLQCAEKSCELVWVPQRTHLVTTPAAA